MSEAPVIAGMGEVLWDVFPDATHFGGAPANFACHAAALGGEAWVVSAVGKDALGDEALRALRSKRVHAGTVRVDPVHATGTVNVSVDAQGQASYVFAADTAWDHLQWSDELALLAGRCDAVCFGSLGQRSSQSRATIRRFVEAVPRAALRVFDVNLRQDFYDAEVIEASLKAASVLKLNNDELPVVLRLLSLEFASEEEALRGLSQRYDLRCAALTRGAAGSLLLMDDLLDEQKPAAITVADTVGAGDAFTATLVTGCLRGVPAAALHAQASAVAAFVCSQRGATPELPAYLQVG